MGSVSRWSAIERYIHRNEQELLEKYQYLIGKTITGIGETQVNYYVGAPITLSDGTVVYCHYRWSGEEEDYEGVESEPDILPMKDYYQRYIIEKTITNISIGTERDDEVYVLAYVDEDYCLEIPLGVDTEAVDENGVVSLDEYEPALDDVFYVVEARKGVYVKDCFSNAILAVALTENPDECKRFISKVEAEEVAAELNQYDQYNASVKPAKEIVVLA